jgi:hypothetical protein
VDLSGAARTDPPELPTVPAYLTLADKDPSQRSTYQDIFSIFLEDSKCTQFFGGVAALEVLNALSEQLEKRALNDGTIGVQMMGDYANYKNMRTGLSFRVFHNAVLNSDGPFYQAACFASRQCIRNIGSFPAGTREAKMLMILHEVAHLIRRPDGRWLIPDDGRNSEQSTANSRMVEKYCGAAIRQVSTQQHFKPLLADRGEEKREPVKVPVSVAKWSVVRIH